MDVRMPADRSGSIAGRDFSVVLVWLDDRPVADHFWQSWDPESRETDAE